MSTITTRAGKGSPLTYGEMDANFTNLNTDKLEAAALAPYETSAHATATYLKQTDATTIYETKINVATGLATKSDTVTTVTKDSSTGAAHIPAGTSAQRPVSPIYGDQRANSTTNAMEWWNGSAWVAMGGGATGGTGNAAFYENDITVTVDYTITTNKNAMSAGPITIADGVTVDIPNGSVWSIV